MQPGRLLRGRPHINCAVSACAGTLAKSADATEGAFLPSPRPTVPAWGMQALSLDMQTPCGTSGTQARYPSSPESTPPSFLLSPVLLSRLIFISAPLVTKWKGHFSDFKINHLQRNPKLQGPKAGSHDQP